MTKKVVVGLQWSGNNDHVSLPQKEIGAIGLLDFPLTLNKQEFLGEQLVKSEFKFY